MTATAIRALIVASAYLAISALVYFGSLAMVQGGIIRGDTVLAFHPLMIAAGPLASMVLGGFMISLWVIGSITSVPLIAAPFFWRKKWVFWLTAAGIVIWIGFGVLISALIY